MRDLNMKLFDPANKELKRCEKIADKVIALEAEYKALSEEELKNKTVLFRERLAKVKHLKISLLKHLQQQEKLQLLLLG